MKTAVVDQCMSGLAAPVSKLPYRKRTQFEGKILDLENLGISCDNTHEHQHVESSTIVEGRSVKGFEVAGQLCTKISCLI